MGWIKNRIEAEHRKHGSMPEGLERYNLDWAKLAEKKILMQIKEEIKNSGAILKEYDFQTGEIEFSMTGELIPVEILEDIIDGTYSKTKTK